jgi:hypothetical protein
MGAPDGVNPRAYFGMPIFVEPHDTTARQKPVIAERTPWTEHTGNRLSLLTWSKAKVFGSSTLPHLGGEGEARFGVSCVGDEDGRFLPSSPLRAEIV